MKNKILDLVPKSVKPPTKQEEEQPPATDHDEESLLRQLVSAGKLDNAEEITEVKQSTKKPVIWGLIVTAFVLGFFGLWAGFAPLESAAIATGSVVLHENRKTIQHLEGGIIQELLVKEGDEVSAGQTLITLNSTSASAQQKLLLGQLRNAMATEARLIAERDDEQYINFDRFFAKKGRSNKTKEIIASQTRLFETRRASIMGQSDILQERIIQYNDQIEGLKAQTKEVRNQIKLIAEEVKTVSYLLDKGMEQKPRLLSLKRRQSELKGEVAKYTAEIATIEGSISETQLQMINVENEYLKEVMTELKDIQQQIADLHEKLNASGDVLKRTVISAPQSGKVNGLQYHTIGGVIAPGAPIMDIIPQNDKLIVEAQVKPEDIDIVHEGLTAKVMLSAYKSRFVPRLNGKITQVSADKFTDEHTGQPYYLAKIEIDDNELESLSEEVELYPGMPTESFINTGATTLLNYLASPIIDSFRRSFKEQ